MEREPEYLQFCNYPEISKSEKNMFFYSEEESDLESSSTSSSLPSLISAVSDPRSFDPMVLQNQDSLSLNNYCKNSMSFEGFNECTVEESGSSETSSDHDSYEQIEDVNCKISYFCPKSVTFDPTGWIKYVSDLDSWSEENDFTNKIHPTCDGILTSELICECSTNLGQLPDSKQFVLTRLIIKNKHLHDISALTRYKYFEYIDMSWNFIQDLKALNTSDYLICLNASHNELISVLDMKPPWFLTKVNLSCNKIKEIGHNLCNFWSLRYIDLSYNLIEKIEGFEHLKYLKYLNLSHNHIKRIENLNCYNVEKLYLEFNDISECDTEGSGLHKLNCLKELNLSHNRLVCLWPMYNLHSLQKLDVSSNLIIDLQEIECLVKLKMLCELNTTSNGVCSSSRYREYVIYMLPSLKSLDCISIGCRERVAAETIFEPNISTASQHLRARNEFWNEISSQTVSAETVPYDQPSLPLLVLVGTFSNYKEDLAKQLVNKFPNHLYRCKKYTNMPLSLNYDHDNLVSITMDEFVCMIKSGRFLTYYNEIGYLFGICRQELHKCMLNFKIGIIESTLEAALTLRASGLSPFLVLCVVQDTSSYEAKLRSCFADLGLENRFRSSPPPQDHLRKHDPVKCEDEVSISQLLEENSFKQGVSLKKNISFSSINRVQWDSSKSLFGSKDHSHSQSVLSSQEVTLGSQKASTVIESDDKVSQLNGREEDEDNFIWSWSLASTIMTDIGPNESHVHMSKKRDDFVRNTLRQQDEYIEIHNRKPSFFYDTVSLNDLESAVKRVGKICSRIINDRKNQKPFESFKDQMMNSSIVKNKMVSLLNDLFNVSSDI